MTKTADDVRLIWRDYVTDAVPSSGANPPNKLDIRDWSGALRVALTQDTTLYFGAGGDDASDGSTTPKRFATLNGAVAYCHAHIDRCGFSLVLQAFGAPATFTGIVKLLPVVGGDPGGYATNELVIRGDTTNLGSAAGGYTIDTTATDAATFTGVNCYEGWRIEGFEIKAHTSRQVFLADFGTTIYVGKNKYTNSPTQRYLAEFSGSRIEIVADQIATQPAAVEFYAVDEGAKILAVSGISIALAGAYSSAVAAALKGGSIGLTGVTFTGSPTGTKWICDEFSKIDYNGTDVASLNNLPGSVGGTFTPLSLERGGTGRTVLSQILGGDTVMVNGRLVATAGSSALTIALKTWAGNDPSSTDKVYVAFRNATGTTGDYTVLEISAATSLVISSGSTLEVPSSTGFRLWIAGFNDAGTFRLGVINCLVGGASPTRIVPLAEWGVASSTAEGGAGAADSAGVFYTGTAVSSKAYRILGFLEWSASGLTAGTWTTTNLATVQQFGPGIKKPGDVVQSVYGSTSTAINNSTSTYSTSNLSASITPTSAANLVRARAHGTGRCDSGSTGIVARLHRGATAVGSEGEVFAAGGASWGQITNMAIDAPNTTSATTYAVKIKNTDNATQVSYPKGNAADVAVIEVDEIMV